MQPAETILETRAAVYEKEAAQATLDGRRARAVLLRDRAQRLRKACERIHARHQPLRPA